MTCIKTALCKNCSEVISDWGEEFLEGMGDECLIECMNACKGLTRGLFASYNPDKDVFVGHVVSFLERKEILKTSEISQDQVAYVPTCEPYLHDDDTYVYCWCE